MAAQSTENLFRVGDVVVYRPSERGWGYEVMWLGKERLVPGKEYVVAEIQDGQYLVVKALERHPPGGLHWAEFQPKT
jgi:hypothetical protein